MNSNLRPNCQTHIFKILFRYQDLVIIEDARNLENLKIKYFKHKQQLTFLHRCRSHNVTPNSFRVKVLVHSREGRMIANTTGKKFITAAINKHHFELKNFSNNISFLEDKLANNLLKEHFDQLINYLNKKANYLADIDKMKLINKFNCLIRSNNSRMFNHQNNSNHNWVLNLSKRALSSTEIDLLSKGLNFAVTPKNLNVVDFLAPIEKGIGELDDKSINEIRFSISNILKSYRIKECNLTKHELRALRSLHNDDSILIVPADKGCVSVVMDADVYNKKLENLLNDSKTYEIISNDPTKAQQAEMNKFLLNFYKKGKLSYPVYRNLHCSKGTIPRFYGLPKIHKKDIPLRPIVSFIPAPTYNLSKFLSEILRPYSINEFSIKNSEQFVDSVKNYILHSDDVCISFDVVALFTSVPINLACEAVLGKLKNDTSLNNRTTLSPEEICDLLRFCLNSTAFTCRGKFYKQKFGTAMGSPVSPIIANITMDQIERQAIGTFLHPPNMWKRYVDDTFCIINRHQVDSFLIHLNSISKDIQFTMEKENNGCLAFLDVLVHHNSNGTLSTSVYRKPTHTDRLLDFTSCHPQQHKASTVKTLFKRAEKIPSSQSYKDEEILHLRTVFEHNNYPEWFIKKHSSQKQRMKITDSKKPYVSLPYIQGITEPITRVLRNFDINTSSKPVHTLRQILSHPKDRLSSADKSSVIYSIPCESCDRIYVGQTGRTLGTRIKEHKSCVRLGQTEKSAIADHHSKSGHTMDWDKVKILHSNKCTNQRLFMEGWEINRSKVLAKNRGEPIPDIYKVLN